MAKTEINDAVVDDDKVEVELFYDGKKYKGDVVVGVNGEFIQIQRGKKVTIDRKYAEVLENAERQRKQAVEYKNKLLNNLNNKKG